MFKILPFIVARGLFSFLYWMIFAYFPIFLKSYGIKDTQIGLVIGSYSFAALSLMIPIGLFSDRLSSKKLLLFCSSLFTLHFLALTTAKTFLPILISVILGGFGAGGLIIILPTLFLKYVGSKGKEIAYFQASSCLGYALGPFCGGILLEHFPLNSLFYLAILAGIIFIMDITLLPDMPPTVFLFKDYYQDLKNPFVWMLMGSILILGIHFGIERVNLSLYMKIKLNTESFYIGFFFTLIGIWMAIISPPLGYLKGIKNRAFSWLGISLFLSGVFQGITGLTTTFKSFVLVRLIHTTGDSLTLLETSLLTALLFPSQRLGGHSGLLFTIRTGATFLGATIAGIINQNFGYALPFIISGCLSISWAFFLIFFQNKNFLIDKSFQKGNINLSKKGGKRK